MKKTLALVLLLTLVAMAAWMHAESRAKVTLAEKVDLVASRYDPAEMELQRIDPMKSHTLLPDGIECGFLRLGDGSEVKFWFLSHHIGRGLGLTRFDFADGSRMYLRGISAARWRWERGLLLTRRRCSRSSRRRMGARLEEMNAR